MAATVSDGRNTVGGDMLRNFVERVERLEAERAGLGDDIKAVMAEAKAAGLVPKIVRAIVAIRRKKPHDYQEDMAMLDMYLSAIGMGEPPPLFRALDSLIDDTASRESVIDGLKKLAPATGDIIVRMGDQPVRIYRNKDGVAQVVRWSEPKPAAAPPAGGSAAPALPERKDKPAPPDVDGDGAEALGRQAARDNKPVIANPFPYGDERRRRFDEGWRRESGGDGMGPDS